MSFKRETNDLSYLNSLRQRRIKDLLAEDIPENEASLLSNGRFACTVCPHKPVFDTVNMLTVHRSGKRHEANAHHHKQEKEELIQLINKRRNEEYLKTGSTDIKIAAVHMKSLVNSAPYDSRVKKNNKPYDRKPKINLTSSVEATSSNKLPGNRTSEMMKMQNESPLKHPRQLKKIFESPKSGFKIQPYQRKSGESVNVPIFSGRTNDQMTGCDLKKADDSGAPGVCSSILSGREGSSVESLPLHGKFSIQTENCTSKAESVLVSDNLEKIDLAKKYWQMAGSGWKKDWDGKWIRDEECEFDSDEEPPDLP